MNSASDTALIAQSLQQLYAAAGLSRPSSTDALAPVPLDQLIASYNLVHTEAPGLSPAVAGAYLERWGTRQPELFESVTPLAGFLFANARGGYILVRAEDSLARRRFTAAHELGHYLLHFLPLLHAAENLETCLVRSDDAQTVCEDDSPAEDGPSLPDMERQANSTALRITSFSHLIPYTTSSLDCGGGHDA